VVASIATLTLRDYSMGGDEMKKQNHLRPSLTPALERVE
jgi:hypothetical protein